MDDLDYAEQDRRTGEIRPGGLRESGTAEMLGQLYCAIGKAQATFEPIARSRTVKIAGQASSYSFDYAPLEDLLAATRKSLSANGLAILTPIYRHEGEAQVLIIVAHEAGGRIMVPFGFTPQSEIKGLGAQITYLRRYGYAAMLNLTADTDDLPDQPPGDRQIRAGHARTSTTTAPDQGPGGESGSTQVLAPTGPIHEVRGADSSSGDTESAVDGSARDLPPASPSGPGATVPHLRKLRALAGALAAANIRTQLITAAELEAISSHDAELLIEDWQAKLAPAVRA